METVTLVAALIAAFASLASAVLGSWLAYRSSLLEVHAETRSANRKVWMNRVIESVRELVVLCKHKPGDAEGLTRLTIELDLLLNPEDAEYKSEELVMACRVLETTLGEIRSLRTEESWRAYSERIIETLVRPVKTVLAHEWSLVMNQK